MEAEKRRRAGRAVAARINELHTTITAVARDAQLDRKTVRGLIDGTRWPTFESRRRITRALGWPAGEIARAAEDGGDKFEGVSTREMLGEVVRRVELLESSLESK